MRRFVAILLLLVLSVQFTWAAAASYCEHDEDASTQHLGHHEHRHGEVANGAASADVPNVDVDVDVDGSGTAGVHADCASCHLSAAKTFSNLAMSVPDGDAGAPELATAAVADSLLLDRIERPKWHRA